MEIVINALLILIYCLTLFPLSISLIDPASEDFSATIITVTPMMKSPMREAVPSIPRPYTPCPESSIFTTISSRTKIQSDDPIAARLKP